MFDDELNQKLIAFFKDRFEGDMFKTSMGEQRVTLTSAHALHGFIAQAMAYLMVKDPRYLVTATKVHRRLLNGIEQATPGDPFYNMAINIGPIIEAAFAACIKLRDDGEI